jgi:hypothetical protein
MEAKQKQAGDVKKPLNPQQREVINAQIKELMENKKVEEGKLSKIYGNRGAANLSLGEHKGSIADSKESIRLDKEYNKAYVR